MAKAIGLLLIVGLVWVGVEVMTQGVDGAFGGAFAELQGREPAADPDDHEWAGERARDSVMRASAESEERRKRMLGE